MKNWDDMELLWNYTFYEKLGINPSDYKIMLTEPPMNPLATRSASRRAAIWNSGRFLRVCRRRVSRLWKAT